MPSYFVTGATGLIGRELIPHLIARGGELTVLVRAVSSEQHAERLAQWSARATQAGGSFTVLTGDLRQPGLSDDPDATLPRADHVFHLAALYDLAASPEELEATNVGGTDNLIAALRAVGFAGVLHHVSSIAVAGDFAQRFTEAQLEAGQSHPHPYQQTKYVSEQHVRALSDLRYRIYRPSAVVGHSRTGEIDRVDGPYFLFKPILKLRNALPAWFPIFATRGMQLNMVPVDYVASAIDHLAHAAGLDGKTFHIVDPDPPRFKESFNLIADAAGAPRVRGTIGGGLLKYIPGGAAQMLGQLGTVKFFRDQLLGDLDIPVEIIDAINRTVTFDTVEIEAALAGSGIVCPRQASYIPALWDYWLRNLDPDRDPALRRRDVLAGKVVLITGASSGIGATLAEECASYGAHVILVARREEELAAAAAAARHRGGQATYYAVDLSDLAACDRLIDKVLQTHERVDVLVNNAARSIRRPLTESLERYHDFERVMQLNYFAPLRLIRGFLPQMRARRTGWIINVLSAGVVIPTPMFGAYGASKAALGHLSDTLAVECLADGLHVAGVYLPFVRTPMMSDEVYDEHTRAMTPKRAADWIIDAVVLRKRHVIPGAFIRRAIINQVAPTFLSRIFSIIFRVAQEDDAKHPELALDRMLLKRVVKGRLV